jgi:hypothetical protein
MRIQALLTATLLLALAAPAVALPPLPVKLSPAQLAKIRQGDVAVELFDTGRQTMKDVVSIGYVDAPPAAVWRVITDYENYPRIFPNIKRSETRAKKGNVEDHYSELDYPWPLPDKWVVNRITHEPAKFEARWHRIDGTVKEVVGSWKLIAEGKRTLVIYTVRVDPGLPLVPAWAITFGTSRVAPEIVRGLRKHIR